MAHALRSTWSGRRRPKHRALPCRRITAPTLSSSTASVVVLNPPAVEPGEPPASMSRMVISWLQALSWVKSTVLKPAVRGETD